MIIVKASHILFYSFKNIKIRQLKILCPYGQGHGNGLKLKLCFRLHDFFLTNKSRFFKRFESRQRNAIDDVIRITEENIF